MLDDGMSLTKISKQCEYSVAWVSKWCDEYGIEKPKIGRPKGYKPDESTKEKMSQSIREAKNEG